MNYYETTVYAAKLLKQAINELDELKSSSAPTGYLSYTEAKQAIELFDSEWIGQDARQLWNWAVSEATKDR